jgi:lauroyl/myristoyl acyltransferase
MALRTGRPLLVARALRVGPDRFTATAWPVEAQLTGDRRADAEALSRAMVARFEKAIAEAPEQWFAVFQPIWKDQRS